jgi:hypothetical protein
LYLVMSRRTPQQSPQQFHINVFLPALFVEQ